MNHPQKSKVYTKCQKEQSSKSKLHSDALRMATGHDLTTCHSVAPFCCPCYGIFNRIKDTKATDGRTVVQTDKLNKGTDAETPIQQDGAKSCHSKAKIQEGHGGVGRIKQSSQQKDNKATTGNRCWNATSRKRDKHSTKDGSANIASWNDCQSIPSSVSRHTSFIVVNFNLYDLTSSQPTHHCVAKLMCEHSNEFHWFEHIRWMVPKHSIGHKIQTKHAYEPYLFGLTTRGKTPINPSHDPKNSGGRRENGRQ
mmetsp:Transcript_50985/g.76246  ORF Transcript_50985/g.76246 Transcript_50985/m.76246 type:complete len:253 (-) Transcript_50985:32-790(-)